MQAYYTDECFPTGSLYPCCTAWSTDLTSPRPRVLCSMLHAFPRLLKPASEPCLYPSTRGRSPGSSASSDYSIDSPPNRGPLQPPVHPAQVVGYLEDHTSLHASTSEPVSPKSQRLPRSRDSRPSRDTIGPPLPHIPAKYHPVPFHGGGAFSPPASFPLHALAWYEPWDPHV